MRILSPVVDPATCLLPVSISYGNHLCAVVPEPICNNNAWLAVPLHGSFYEFKCCFAITAFTYSAFQHFTSMITSTPKIMRSPLIFAKTSAKQVSSDSAAARALQKIRRRAYWGPKAVRASKKIHKAIA